MLNRLSIFFPRFEARSLPGDVLGGVTAAVVALAFGIAAGLGPAAGVYGAISVGFFTAVFGGTRSLISGPTGSMTVAMAVIVAAHADNIAEAFTIVIMAGLIQMVFGLLRLGQYVTYTPYSVISGFMTGVGASYCCRPCPSWERRLPRADRSERFGTSRASSSTLRSTPWAWPASRLP